MIGDAADRSVLEAAGISAGAILITLMTTTSTCTSPGIAEACVPMRALFHGRTWTGDNPYRAGADAVLSVRGQVP